MSEYINIYIDLKAIVSKLIVLVIRLYFIKTKSYIVLLVLKRGLRDKVRIITINTIKVKII